MSETLKPVFEFLFNEGDHVPTLEELMAEIWDPKKREGFRVEYRGERASEIWPVAVRTSRNAGYGLDAVALSPINPDLSNRIYARGLYIVARSVTDGNPIVLRGENEPAIHNQRDSYFTTLADPQRTFITSDPESGIKYVESLIASGIPVREIPEGYGVPSEIQKAFKDIFKPFQRED